RVAGEIHVGDHQINGLARDYRQALLRGASGPHADVAQPEQQLQRRSYGRIVVDDEGGSDGHYTNSRARCPGRRTQALRAASAGGTREARSAGQNAALWPSRSIVT